MTAAMRMLAFAALAACLLPAAEKKAPPWEKPGEIGRNLYRQNCIVCHDIEQAETKKMGPSLFRLFQNETLPSSPAAPTIEYVKVKTQYGGSVMPAFIDLLKDDQIDEILSYIRTKE